MTVWKRVDRDPKPPQTVEEFDELGLATQTELDAVQTELDGTQVDLDTERTRITTHEASPHGGAVVQPTKYPVANEPTYDPIASSNSQAIIDAVARAVAEGGGIVVYPRGETGYDQDINIGPPKVGGMGYGSGRLVSGSVLVARNAASRLRVGNRGDANNRGPDFVDFDINGADLANDPFTLGLVVNRVFRNMHLWGGVLQNLLIEEAQNCRFFSVYATHSLGDGIVFDFGTGGHDFFGCNTRDNRGWSHRYRQTGVATAGLYPEPRNNSHYGLIMEGVVPGVTPGLILHEAGNSNDYFKSVFSAPEANSAIPLVKMTQAGAIGSGGLGFHSPWFAGDVAGAGAAFVRAIELNAGCSAYLTGIARYINCFARWVLNAGTAYEETVSLVNTPNDFVGAGSASAIIRNRTRILTEATIAAAADPYFLGLVKGEAGLRHRWLVDRIEIGSGADFAPDVAFRRIAANVAGVGADDMWRTGVTTTAARPTPAAAGEGSSLWDSDLKKQIWSDGVNWRDGAGTAV